MHVSVQACTRCRQHIVMLSSLFYSQVLLPLQRDDKDYKKYIGDNDLAKNFGRI